jgi:RimJ/RimL family protein N-acetyltransferase
LHWLDDPSDLSCKYSTCQYAVDHSLLSCNPVPLLDVMAVRKTRQTRLLVLGGLLGRLGVAVDTTACFVVVRGTEGACSVTSRRPSPAPAGADERILTARLELQPVVEADAEALAEVFLDERMYRFTGGQPGTLEDLRASFARIEAQRANDRDGTAQHNWTVRRRADGQAVGMVQAVVADGGRNAEIAWAVGVPWQGQGIASEATQAVVAWLEAHGVDTVTAHVNPDHHASVGVATRAGLHPTGEVREQRGIGEQLWRRGPMSTPPSGQATESGPRAPHRTT